MMNRTCGTRSHLGVAHTLITVHEPRHCTDMLIAQQRNGIERQPHCCGGYVNNVKVPAQN